MVGIDGLSVLVDEIIVDNVFILCRLIAYEAGIDMIVVDKPQISVVIEHHFTHALKRGIRFVYQTFTMMRYERSILHFEYRAIWTDTVSQP